jgi:hypothetical protein
MNGVAAMVEAALWLEEQAGLETDNIGRSPFRLMTVGTSVSW